MQFQYELDAAEEESKRTDDSKQIPDEETDARSMEPQRKKLRKFNIPVAKPSS